MTATDPLAKRPTDRRIPLAPLFLVLAVTLGACGAADGSDEARVFFQEPRDGETVTSPVTLVFGHENIELSPVPETVDSPRPGVIHHHVGLNTDCLPPGTEVPQADPWIHFGDGSNEIEMNLPPGEHRLVVQAGDDQHRTIAGLCEIITVTVSDEG